jgi:hypothetical protein
MIPCINQAAARGILTQAEARDITNLYNQYLQQTGSPSTARHLVLGDLQAEITERKRIAFLAEERRISLLAEIEGFRDAAGQADLALAFRLLHDRMGHEGVFESSKTDDWAGISAEALEKSILAETISRIHEAENEFRPGLISGDKARTSKLVAAVSPNARRMQARMREVVKAMRGENTTDARAQDLAKILMDESERLRLEFNRLGGNIGKLENRGPPQSHDQKALIEFGEEAWIELLMGDGSVGAGLLDRDRMVHPLTGNRLTDDQLREALSVSYRRIVTDGFVDREVTGAPTGRGALWTQHADHRFLHFKSAEAWLEYAENLGNPDPFAAQMAEFQMMARDIAHMKKFGPNPNVMRTYLKNHITKQAAQIRFAEAAFRRNLAQIGTLRSQLTPAATAASSLAAQLQTLHQELGRMYDNGLRNRSRAQGVRQQIIALEAQLAPYAQSQTLGIDDIARLMELRQLSEEMRDRPTFAHVDRPEEYAVSSLKFTDFVWEMLRGSTGVPLVVRVPLMPTWSYRKGWGIWKPDIGSGFDTTRNIITASSLHSAVLSAVSDPGFASVRRAFVGMSMAQANPITIIRQTLAGISMGEGSNRRYVARSAVISDSVIRAWTAQARYNGAIDLRKFSGYIAERVIALQGLSAWTTGGKVAGSLELMGFFADHVDRAWGDLPVAVSDTLRRAGFDADSWDTIRAVPLDQPQPGATFLRPNEIAQTNEALGLRYAAMIMNEVRYMVPESTPTARATMMGGTTPGSVGGVLARSFSQFKSFGFTVVMLHLGQIAASMQAGQRVTAASYAATLLITGTLLGAFAMALKDMNAGRDPKSMLDDETFFDLNFWGAAMLQAGGLGIYGDFLFANLNRFGGSLPGTVAGPIWGRLDNIKNLTFGNLQQVMRGEDTKFGKELANFLRMNTPNIVFTKLATDRLVMDQIQIMMDPEAYRGFNRAMKSRRREYGQEYWWKLGETGPDRAPDPTSAFTFR